MTLPRLPRWLAPVLVVIFVLVTVWAAYNVAHEVAASRVTSTSGPPLPYEGSGAYRYTASLDPNDLFNSTTVSGTNVTLFVPITKWINVTFVDSLNMTFFGAASLSDRFTVNVSTPAWTKTIETVTQENGSASTAVLTVTDRYDLNVSVVETLVRTVDQQLNYSASSFTVRLAATVSGAITLDRQVAPVLLTPELNLSFQGSVIAPKGTLGSYAGEIAGPADPGDPVSGSALAAAYAELAASGAALAFSVWLLWVTRQEWGSSALPTLDRLIEPYEEVIARTTGVPESAKVLAVERWEDLVKVADTLGRPILRPLPTPIDPQGTGFCVYDGTVAYVYRYPVAGSKGPRSSPPPRAPPSLGQAGLGASHGPVAAATPSKPPAGGAAPSTSRPPAKGRSITDQLEVELKRFRTAPLDPALRWYALSLFTQAVRSVSSATPEDAQRTVDQLRKAIDRILSES